MLYMLTEMGLSVNDLDYEGNAPLHLAVQNKHETTVKFLITLGAAINVVDKHGNSPLHISVKLESQSLRICKDLCIKGADRRAKNKAGITALEQATQFGDQLNNYSSFKSVLSSQWYMQCPFYKLPFMPVERNNRFEVLFLVLFIFIWLNNIVVIEPVLDVYYFMVSTTLCMVKLAMTFYMMTSKNPGYVEKDSELDWEEVMLKIPSKYLCLQCKVIRPPRSQHCNVCDKCVDRYDSHSFWTNSCVGR